MGEGTEPQNGEAPTGSIATPTDREDYRDAMNLALRQDVWRAIRPVALALSLLYAVFTVSHLQILPDDINVIMAALAAGTAVFMLLTATIASRSEALQPFTHPLSFVMVMLALLNSALHLYLTDEIRQTTNIILVVFGTSFFIQSTPWFATALLATLVSWLAALLHMTPQPALQHFAFALLSATLVSVLFHWLRLRTLRENHRLHFVSEAQRRELEVLATHDFLTGVANRRLFIERLEQAMAECNRTGTRVGLLFCDLNDFKPMNDTYGHAFGDEVLKAVARLRFEGYDEPISASLGTAAYPDDASDLDSLLEHADVAMYSAKAQYRDNA